jgi:hypothetical protein
MVSPGHGQMQAHKKQLIIDIPSIDAIVKNLQLIVTLHWGRQT